MSTHHRVAAYGRTLILTATLVSLLSACAARTVAPGDEITITLIGTHDVHGELVSRPARGGLVAISAYVDAVRAARRQDNGAVLLIDAGDMWQGTLESNLVEGTAVVEAYNAIGYDAAAIGNHEFDFGPIGRKAIPEDAGDDPRGVLKQRASEAAFPILAANLIDESTGSTVAWNNVRPSVILDAAGIKVGIIGVLSENALYATISANTQGLRIAPIVPTIIAEAKKLRARGASIVIVTAHAGGRCTEFESRTDTSSCNMSGEIMRVASELPEKFVDHIFAGHVHQGIAHIVNGISITSSYSNTRAFSRVDLGYCTDRGRVCSRTVHAPHHACLSVVASSGACALADDDPADVVAAVYEGRELEPDPAVVEIAARAAHFAETIKSEKLGVRLLAGFRHPPATETPLANLMTDALLDSMDADIALHNVVGGIRDALPPGDLTYGSVYQMFPFDNRVVMLDLSGRELRTVIAAQARNRHRRAGFSGMRVFVDCTDDKIGVVMTLANGATIRDDDRLRVIVNDYLALGGDGILTPIIPEGGFAVNDSMPLTRDVLVDWFRARTAPLHPDEFLSTANPRWNLPASLPDTCMP